MQKYYILVSESNIGIHSKTNQEGHDTLIELVDFTFFPVVRKIGDKKDFVNTSLLDIKKLYEKIENFKKKYDVIVLIGFDLDPIGDMMSLSVQETLIEYGVSSSCIFRTPLTQQGYMAFKEFPKAEGYKEYLYLQEKFMQQQRSRGIKKPIGFQKAISLELLNTYKGKKSLVESGMTSQSGVSTVTVATKFISELKNEDGTV